MFNEMHREVTYGNSCSGICSNSKRTHLLCMFIPVGIWSTAFELLMVKGKFTAPDHV